MSHVNLKSSLIALLFSPLICSTIAYSQKSPTQSADQIAEAACRGMQSRKDVLICRPIVAEYVNNQWGYSGDPLALLSAKVSFTDQRMLRVLTLVKDSVAPAGYHLSESIFRLAREHEVAQADTLWDLANALDPFIVK